MKVVITQPMFFPWAGLLEQLRMADIIVYYNDVQFSKGSLTNRVQIKTPFGKKWLTVPLKNFSFGQLINEVQVQSIDNWSHHHFSLIKQSFSDANFSKDAQKIVDQIYSREYTSIAELSKASMRGICDYYNVLDGKDVYDASDLNISGHSSERVLNIVKKLDGTSYITGHGARNYLDHENFEKHGISVVYMDYKINAYRQGWGEFTPHVTALDLIANCGLNGLNYCKSNTVHWKNFPKIKSL